MPLVFVHGVNNRRGETPEEQQAFDNRRILLREQFGTAFSDRVTAPDGLAAFTPYWGGLGVKFARNLACLPQTGIQALATEQPEDASLAEATVAELDAEMLQLPGVTSAPLLTIAKAHSLPMAVDLLFAGAANAPLPALVFDEVGLKETLTAGAVFAGDAERYAAAYPTQGKRIKAHPIFPTSRIFSR